VRTSFDLKIVAETLEEAKSKAISEIARFLEVDPEEVYERVDMELKVSYPKAESVPEIEEAYASKIFQVIAFANLKQGIAKPFGH
jgi:hypothetical protein